MLCWRKGKCPYFAMMNIHIFFSSDQEREQGRGVQKIQDGRSKILWHVSKHLCKPILSLPAQADPQSRQEIQLCTVQQVIWPSCSFEDPLPHSHWGETAQVHTMQLFNQCCFPSENSYYGTHWRETTQVQSMLVCFNQFRQSEEAQQDPLWGKASQMHNVRVFKHSNWSFERSHGEAAHGRKAIQV